MSALLLKIDPVTWVRHVYAVILEYCVFCRPAVLDSAVWGLLRVLRHLDLFPGHPGWCDAIQ